MKQALSTPYLYIFAGLFIFTNANACKLSANTTMIESCYQSKAQQGDTLKAELPREAVSNVPEAVNAPEKTYFMEPIDKKPAFPGGTTALKQWLSKRIRYPKAAEKQGIQGSVLVDFIVEKNGSITNVHIVRSIHPLLNNEALRVVRRMPRWKPGELKGRKVRVRFRLPVIFILK